MPAGSGRFGKVEIKCELDSLSKLLEEKLATLDRDVYDETVEDLGWSMYELAQGLPGEYAHVAEDYERTIPDHLSPIMATVYSTKKGWQLVLSGEDILYREFGTGQRGMENPNNNQDMLDAYSWNYDTGQNVLHNGGWNNQNVNAERTPAWYTKGLNGETKKPIRTKKSDYVWMTPYGFISHGIPAANIWSDMIFRVDEADPDDDVLDFDTFQITNPYSKRKLRMRVRDAMDKTFKK